MVSPSLMEHAVDLCQGGFEVIEKIIVALGSGADGREVNPSDTSDI